MAPPNRHPRLQRALEKKLGASDPQNAPVATNSKWPWRDRQEMIDATLAVGSRYKKAAGPTPGLWLVQPLPLDAPTEFVVVRVSELPVVGGSGVYCGDTAEKAKAVADALNTIEREVERGDEPDDLLDP